MVQFQLSRAASLVKKLFAIRRPDLTTGGTGGKAQRRTELCGEGNKFVMFLNLFEKKWKQINLITIAFSTS